MILPDVNVLIYAFREDAPLHRVARSWLRETVMGPSQFGISPLVLSAVVRVTTNAHVYKPTSSLEDAVGYCEDLLGQPHCQAVEPGSRHWEIFTNLCVSMRITGPSVADAWFAALAIEWGCEWITFDRGFARFPGLKWSVPKAQQD
jgi:toxin-antitoxin system PIN domain toxin